MNRCCLPSKIFGSSSALAGLGILAVFLSAQPAASPESAVKVVSTAMPAGSSGST